jgi:hypothetical protein
MHGYEFKCDYQIYIRIVVVTNMLVTGENNYTVVFLYTSNDNRKPSYNWEKHTKKNIQIYANASLRRLRQKELNPKAELGN